MRTIAMVCVMALGLSTAALAEQAPTSESQQKVWKAEEGLVMVALKTQDELLKLVVVLDADKQFFAPVSPKARAGFSALVSKSVAAQKRLIDLGVLSSAGRPGDYRFMHSGKAPSTEAVSAFTDYTAVMSQFDADENAKEVLTFLIDNFKKDQGSVPTELNEALMTFAMFARQFQAVQMAAGALLGSAIEENGGKFNSRWGLEHLLSGAAAK